MFDEGDYPTLKLMKCKKCGYIFTGSLTGENDCPECDSNDTTNFKPHEEQNRSDANETKE